MHVLWNCNVIFLRERFIVFLGISDTGVFSYKMVTLQLAENLLSTGVKITFLQIVFVLTRD